MSITISGTLVGPVGNIRANTTIMLVAVDTSVSVIVRAYSETVTDAAGKYKLTVEPGEYSVVTIEQGGPPERVGKIKVLSDSIPGTLNDFLKPTDEEELTPEVILKIEQMRNEAQVAAAAAKTSETNAVATLANALTKSDNLSSLDNKAIARRNLGVGNAVRQFVELNAARPAANPNYGQEYLILHEIGVPGPKTIQGFFSLSRGTESLGNRVSVIEIISQTAYNSSFIQVSEKGTGKFLSGIVELTYSGKRYFALRYSQSGGNPNNGHTFYGDLRGVTGDEFKFISSLNDEITDIVDISNAALASEYTSLNKPTATEIGALKLGDYGIGCHPVTQPNSKTYSNADDIQMSGWFSGGGIGSTNFYNYTSPIMAMTRPGGGDATGYVGQLQIGDKGLLATRLRASNVWAEWNLMWGTANTTVDSNGFIKKASPILRLSNDPRAMSDDFLDGFTLSTGVGAVNGEADGVIAKRKRKGVYTVSGSLGLATEGWTFEVPQDQNGNRLCFVETETAEDGTITVTVSKRKLDLDTTMVVAGDPMDIPAGRWVDLRLEMPPQPEPEPIPEPVETLPTGDEDGTTAPEGEPEPVETLPAGDGDAVQSVEQLESELAENDALPAEEVEPQEGQK